MKQYIVTRKLKDLPYGYSVPNTCEYCGIIKAYDRASSFVWATDGTVVHTHGFCSVKCARLFIDRYEEFVKSAQYGIEEA